MWTWGRRQNNAYCQANWYDWTNPCHCRLHNDVSPDHIRWSSLSKCKESNTFEGIHQMHMLYRAVLVADKMQQQSVGTAQHSTARRSIMRQQTCTKRTSLINFEIIAPLSSWQVKNIIVAIEKRTPITCNYIIILYSGPLIMSNNYCSAVNCYNTTKNVLDCHVSFPMILENIFSFPKIRRKVIFTVV